MRKPTSHSKKEKTKLNRSVTIKDLAVALDLSITTISRALNGYSDVGDKTRNRVIAAAQEHGYRPNRNAQRLVTQRTHNIAWIQSDNDRKFVDPHFVEVMAGVLRAARAANYDIVLTGDTSENQINVYDRYIRDNSVDGFIVDLPQPVDDRIDHLIAAKKPFVVHGRNGRHESYSFIDVDNFENFYRLTQLMATNGHSNIAFINGDEHYAYAAIRGQAVKQALFDLGMAESSVRVYNAVHPMGNAGYQLTTQALADGEVTALIYSSALMAVEGHSALLAAGRRPLENICVATMDDALNYLDLSHFKGKFTFVRSSLRDAGAALVDDLVRQCENDNSVRHTIIPSRFVLAPDLKEPK